MPKNPPDGIVANYSTEILHENNLRPPQSTYTRDLIERPLFLTSASHGCPSATRLTLAD